VIDRELLEHTF